MKLTRFLAHSFPPSSSGRCRIAHPIAPLIRRSRVSPLTRLRSISHGRPAGSIVSQLPPSVFDLCLEPLPDMSLTRVAPFAEIADAAATTRPCKTVKLRFHSLIFHSLYVNHVYHSIRTARVSVRRRSVDPARDRVLNAFRNVARTKQRPIVGRDGVSS